MDAADVELLTRSLRHATGAHTGAALDAALDDVGWADAFTADDHAAVSLLFELQGEANAASSGIGHLLGGDAGTVLPRLGSSRPPGTIAGGSLRVDGLATAALQARPSAVVPAIDGDKVVLVRVPVPALAIGAVRGIDPWLELVEVRGDVAPFEAGGDVDWRASVAIARLAAGHELLGASRRMLSLARDHALGRIQFGHPIASFQAVRHRLAETLVAIETAASVLDAGWADRSPQTAAMAKAVAGRSARTTARHCQQVLAGIGFTTEHPLHRYVRRVLVLDELLGSARALTRELGEELLATRRLPALLPL